MAGVSYNLCPECLAPTQLCSKFRVTPASGQAATCRPREERDGPVEAGGKEEEGGRGL